MSYTASYIVNSSSAQGTTDFQFTFPYIKEEHIEVYLNYSKITQGSGSTQYQVITNVSPKLIRLNTGIASANLRVEVRRNSSLGTPLVDYADGSTLTANDLDTSSLQSLYIDQELKDNQGKTVSVDETTGLPELNNLRLTNVGDPTAAQDAVTKAYLERTGSITSTQILDGTIVNADINASAAISGSKLQLASGSNPGALSTSDFSKLGNIETGATADQTAAEIRTLVEAASDSNVFTDADHTKLNAIEAGATADQTNAEIRAAVEAASDSNVFTDADHTKLNAIEANATADQTASEIKSLIATSPLDASHLAANSVGDSEIATGALDNRYYTETELDAGQLDNRYYTEAEADARFYNLSSGEEIQSGETWSAADNKIATTAAIDARITDLVEEVGGFVPIANETSFPAANPDINNGAGTLVSVKAFASSHTPSGGSVTIANGAGSGNTVTITGCGSTVLAAGFGGIVETTSTLHTYTFHRLTPKATEVTTVAGNITNINTVGNNSTNINTVAGNNSNINTVAGISGNVTTVAGISSNVTSVANNSSNINSVNSNSSNINTVAGSISNVNTVGGAIANVNTVATNISGVNDFADRYRIASSDPTSNNDEGDLCFNTTTNELRVYNGSAWQGGVTATGNLAGLGSNTFTGTQTFVAGQTFDGRDVSADGTKLDGIETAATADQTAAEIRTLVENAGDSNVFTDADHTKLNGIEASATADQTAAEILTAIKTVDGAGSGLDADTLDGVDSGSFLRSDANDSISGVLTFTNGNYPITVSSTGNGKLLFEGSNNPFIQFREGTTDKAFVQWHSDGYLRLKNEEQQAVLRIQDDIKFSPDDSTYHSIWHAGNDGAGSGLDADTLDGVQGSNYLRSDQGDTFNGVLTINDGNNQKLILQGSSDPYIRLRSGTTNKAYWEYNGGYVFLWNEHVGKGLRLGSQPYFYDASAYREIIHQNNVGSSGALSSSNVYVNEIHGDGSNLTNLPSTGGTTPTVKTANYTASNGDMVVINGTGLTITLPSGPSVGDSVKIRILGDRYCTVARNSQNIEGSATNFYVDVFDGCATFTYADSTRGWLIGC